MRIRNKWALTPGFLPEVSHHSATQLLNFSHAVCNPLFDLPVILVRTRRHRLRPSQDATFPLPLSFRQLAQCFPLLLREWWHESTQDLLVHGAIDVPLPAFWQWSSPNVCLWHFGFDSFDIPEWQEVLVDVRLRLCECQDFGRERRRWTRFSVKWAARL